MFVPPIWIDEVRRIGKPKCSPLSYAVHNLGELIGLIGALLLLLVPLFLAYRAVVGNVSWGLLWLLLIPFTAGALGSLVIGPSWGMVARKQFKFDYERREATWLDGDERRSYTSADWQAEDQAKEWRKS